jgi:hypothetical protein
MELLADKQIFENIINSIATCPISKVVFQNKLENLSLKQLEILKNNKSYQKIFKSAEYFSTNVYDYANYQTDYVVCLIDMGIIVFTSEALNIEFTGKVVLFNMEECQIHCTSEKTLLHVSSQRPPYTNMDYMGNGILIFKSKNPQNSALKIIFSLMKMNKSYFCDDCEPIQINELFFTKTNK